MSKPDDYNPAARLRQSSVCIDCGAVGANAANLDGRTGLRCPPCLAAYAHQLPHPHHRYWASAGRRISAGSEPPPGRL